MGLFKSKEMRALTQLVKIDVFRKIGSGWLSAEDVDDWEPLEEAAIEARPIVQAAIASDGPEAVTELIRKYRTRHQVSLTGSSSGVLTLGAIDRFMRIASKPE